MNEVPPDLADKVIAADIRNLIKKVGDGGTLTGAELQIFIDFSTTQGDAETLKQARVNSLLKKWLSGSRLTPEEKGEIAHVIPTADPAPPRIFEGKADDKAARIGLNRRSFYRWIAAGTTHHDPLPVDDPPSVISWYERMMERGVFKQRLPQKVRKICEQKNPSLLKSAQGSKPQPHDSQETPPDGTPSGIYSSESAGLAADISELEKLITGLRKEAAIQHGAGKVDEAKRTITQCVELLDKVTTFKTRLIKLEENEGITTRASYVAEDLGRIVPSIISNLMQMGAKLHGKSKSELSRAEFIAVFRDALTLCFSELRNSKFAPPMTLAA